MTREEKMKNAIDEITTFYEIIEMDVERGFVLGKDLENDLYMIIEAGTNTEIVDFDDLEEAKRGFQKYMKHNKNRKW